MNCRAVLPILALFLLPLAWSSQPAGAVSVFSANLSPTSLRVDRVGGVFRGRGRFTSSRSLSVSFSLTEQVICLTALCSFRPFLLTGASFALFEDDFFTADDYITSVSFGYDPVIVAPNRIRRGIFTVEERPRYETPTRSFTASAAELNRTTNRFGDRSTIEPIIPRGLLGPNVTLTGIDGPTVWTRDFRTYLVGFDYPDDWPKGLFVTPRLGLTRIPPVAPIPLPATGGLLLAALFLARLAASGRAWRSSHLARAHCLAGSFRAAGAGGSVA